MPEATKRLISGALVRPRHDDDLPELFDTRPGQLVEHHEPVLIPHADASQLTPSATISAASLAHPTSISMTGRQAWLREAAKGYLLVRLSSRQTRTPHRDLVWLHPLSDYLGARDDHGEDPSVLTREDMTGVLSWLRVHVPDPKPRHRVVSARRRTEQFARRRLAGAGQTAAGIGERFQLYHEDHPEIPQPDPDGPGKALPAVVLAQLLDQGILAQLGEGYVAYRVAFELVAHTGRRPSEICHLAADCLR
jgi:hypothetical protein